jgi:hypothetical protein
MRQPGLLVPQVGNPGFGFNNPMPGVPGRFQLPLVRTQPGLPVSLPTSGVPVFGSPVAYIQLPLAIPVLVATPATLSTPLVIPVVLNQPLSLPPGPLSNSFPNDNGDLIAAPPASLMDLGMGLDLRDPLLSAGQRPVRDALTSLATPP